MTVTPLYGGPTGEKKPNDECISVLEEYLEKARSGEVVGVSVAALHHDRLASFRFGGVVFAYSLLGAMTHAQANLAEQL